MFVSWQVYGEGEGAGGVGAVGEGEGGLAWEEVLGLCGVDAGDDSVSIGASVRSALALPSDDTSGGADWWCAAYLTFRFTGFASGLTLTIGLSAAASCCSILCRRSLCR